MHDEDNGVSNNSENRPFEDVLKVNLERRRLLKGSVAAALGAAMMGPTSFVQAFQGKKNWNAPASQGPLLNFDPVLVADGGGINPAISFDYQYDVILPWGDPIVPSGPDYFWPPSSADQAEQVGIGHDGMWFFPMADNGTPRFGLGANGSRDPWREVRPGHDVSNDRGVLCLNNEFGGNNHVLGKRSPTSLDDVRTSQHAHGVTVVELRRTGSGKWKTVQSKLARRIHVNTPVEFSGPVAGHPLLDNPVGNDPKGTVNNCAMGYTPWGTYLTCEENFNGYFGAKGAWTPTPGQIRYGFRTSGFGYGWHNFDERFDLTNPDYVNEHNRFGWVVEIDPMDPAKKPVKRTALGRKKNEGATVHVADDGRVVVYNGDDERFDYIYKYVSNKPWQEYDIANGESPLDDGILYVARFNDDGTGDWLELSMGVPALAAEFTDIGELLINARSAADIVGATPMDRPEWCSVAPDGKVYFTLTNNSERDDIGLISKLGRDIDSGPNPPNPIAINGPGNADGHIICWEETDGHSGTTFDWEFFIFAQDTHGTEASFADPDGLWCDPDGRVFIQTDGGQKDGLNNQMVVADASNAMIKRIFTGVPGCEITGITVTPDRRTMFINVQHPGNGDPDVSNFPKLGAPDGTTIPRDCTIVLTRKDGGVIGS